MCISTAWAVQGLWAGPWLADVDGLPRASVVMHLFVMAVTLSTAALLLVIGADRLRTRGIQTQTILGYAALLFVAAESLLILDVRSVSYASWAVVAGMGAGTVLSYSILAQYFSKEIAGRANAALNVFHIGGTFVLQEVIGWIINQWPAHRLQGRAGTYDCHADYCYSLVRAVRSEAADIRCKSYRTLGL